MKHHASLSESIRQRLTMKPCRRMQNHRRGSTLLVVMALLGMLLLLGMLYFTFATQEQHNATNFAEAAKVINDPGDDIDAIFDEMLGQVIQGPSYDKKNSVLWGGRHSLAYNMLGHDLQPFNGAGVNLYRTSGGNLVVDQDRNGTADSDQSLLEPNDSPAARNAWPPVERRVETFPAPDVDYTYPDINNNFLAYIGTTWKTPVGVSPTGYPVIKPSFHRPELLRDNNGSPITDWATHTGGGSAPFQTGGRLFRPHPYHMYVPRADQQSITSAIRRFLDDYNAADAADIASLASSFAPSAPRGFPLKNVPPLPAAVPPVAPDRQQGVWSMTGPSPATFPAYDFDVDNDNDGTKDSIWMDLDLPVMVRPSDNATYIPLVALLIQDLDSLLNINAVGNLSGDTRTSATSNFGNGADIHHSSMGLSPSEINPLWALDTRPSEAASLSDQTSYFHAPTTTRHLANMEWWWFNKGRVQYTTPRQIFAGRYGEADRVWQVLAAGSPAISVQQTQSNLFPFPGIWDADDNRDANEGGKVGAVGGQAFPFRHPLLLNGFGRFWTAASPKQLNLYAAIGAADPNRWLQYVGAGVGYDGTATTTATGNVAWSTLFSPGPGVVGALMNTPVVGANFAAPVATPAVVIDDPNELTLDPKNLQRPYDEPLDAKDTLLLFLGTSDRSRTGIASRVLDLMPGNISATSASGFYQLQVAKRLTTESWDPKQFALPRFIPTSTGLGSGNKPGMPNVDDNQDGVVDDDNERGWPGSDDDRAWEYNVDRDGNGLLEFPPQFNPASDFRPRIDSTAMDYRPENAYGPNDPFRPQLRRLLTVEFGNASTPRTPMRLSVNDFLDVEHRPGNVSNPQTDPLAYRPLTSHSTDSTLTSVPSVSPLPTYPPTNEGEKEFWARRDRQQMARDIYVMLYTFCGGNDSMNLATTVGDTAYHGKIRRQMAQFAVNMVDAMDRDNVITAFEYDDNLQDGWNLDDDFTTTDGANATTGLLPSGTSRRFVVYGVEAQELTFSEVFWGYQAQSGTDHSLTPINEKAGDHNFLHIELRNIKPEPLDVVWPTYSLAVNKGIWRIHRDDNGDGKLDTTENAVEILKGTTVGASVVPPSQLSVGQLYTIASADYYPAAMMPADVPGASLYVDTSSATSGAELQAPNTGGPVYPPPTPPFVTAANLDLVHADHNGYFALANATTGTGLLNSNNPGPTVTSTTLRLDRRLNPYLVQLPLANNPYTSVDTIPNVQRQNLGIDGSVTTAAMAATKLATLKSHERDQPLNASPAMSSSTLIPTANSTGAAPASLLNTLSLQNSNSSAAALPNGFNLFQPHFDRDFASVVELFDIPLEGPEKLTRMIVDSRRPPNLVDSSGTGIGQLENRGPFTFGGAVLMQSEDRDGDDSLLSTSDDSNNNGIQDGTPAEIDTNGNGYFDFGEDFNKNGALDAHPYHFHRLLSLVEVPTRTHRQLGNPLGVNRVPGKINLNGVRDPRVLGGLIDERTVMNPPDRTAPAAVGGNVDNDGDGIIDTGLQDLLGDTVQDSTGASITRDWWFQFLIARDGLDPTTSLPLPLSGFSRPFRDLGYLSYDQQYGVQSSIEDTILRELPGGVKYSRTQAGGKGKGKGKAKGATGGGSGAAGTADGRRLFELATNTEFENRTVTVGGTTLPLEAMTKYRLLSKIIGNTTTRSNVFVVHATIGMFACKEYSNGAVRIGGQMDVDRDGTPDSYRAIFVIDRSAIEDAYDRGSRTFDWKKLVTARQRIN